MNMDHIYEIRRELCSAINRIMDCGDVLDKITGRKSSVSELIVSLTSDLEKLCVVVHDLTEVEHRALILLDKYRKEPGVSLLRTEVAMFMQKSKEMDEKIKSARLSVDTRKALVRASISGADLSNVQPFIRHK